MMNIGKIPKLSIDGGVNNPFKAGMTGHIQKLQPETDVQKVNFRDVMSNTLGTINDAVSAPDAMMRDAMTTGNVDVHDLMIANAKAELVVSVTTQIATKVVQAYDKILQIQI